MTISGSGSMCATALVLASADVWRTGEVVDVADEAIGYYCCGAELESPWATGRSILGGADVGVGSRAEGRFCGTFVDSALARLPPSEAGRLGWRDAVADVPKVRVRLTAISMERGWCCMTASRSAR